MARRCLSVAVGFLSLLLADSASKALDLEEVRGCLDRAVSEGRRFKRKVEDDVFILDFGDPAIEVFNILAPHDLKRLEYLSACVQREDSGRLFEDKKFVKNGHLEHAGSNITYITGILQSLLPDVAKKIDLALKDAIKEAKWPTQIDQLGIRSVQYISFTHETKMKTRAEVEEEQRLREEARNVFSIGPKPPPKPEVDDPRADEFVRDFMQRDEHSVYTLNLLVNSRNKFQGGEVLVRKHPVRSSGGNDDSYAEEDGYDEDEEEGGGEGGAHSADKPRDVPPAPPKRKVAKFDMLTTTIARYTPEKGGGVLILSNHEHGLHSLARGRRDSLVVEFWPYADAPPGSKRPSIRDARPLPRRDAEL